MSRHDAVQSWWDGLSGEERDEFMSSTNAGAPSAAMQQSMERAGLVEQGAGNIPERVLQHLAEKGTGGPDDSVDGGKMRH